jgi:hypothetical protein
MSTTLIEQEQAETTRLMVMVERLQQAGYDERGIAAAVDRASGRPRASRRLLRLLPWRGPGSARPGSPARLQHARPWI